MTAESLTDAVVTGESLTFAPVTRLSYTFALVVNESQTVALVTSVSVTLAVAGLCTGRWSFAVTVLNELTCTESHTETLTVPDRVLVDVRRALIEAPVVTVAVTWLVEVIWAVMFDGALSDEFRELDDEMDVASPAGTVRSHTTDEVLAMVAERFTPLGVVSTAVTVDVELTVALRTDGATSDAERVLML